jgi:hypothetical protein
LGAAFLAATFLAVTFLAATGFFSAFSALFNLTVPERPRRKSLN